MSEWHACVEMDGGHQWRRADVSAEAYQRTYLHQNAESSAFVDIFEEYDFAKSLLNKKKTSETNV